MGGHCRILWPGLHFRHLDGCEKAAFEWHSIGWERRERPVRRLLQQSKWEWWVGKEWERECGFFFFFLAAQGLCCSMWDPVPQTGIQPRPPALGAQSLSHWTTREVPETVAFWRRWKQAGLSDWLSMKARRREQSAQVRTLVNTCEWSSQWLW